MTHFGIICPPTTGHLNTIFPLGQELQRRGHRITLFGILDAQSKTLEARLGFQAIGEEEFPVGAVPEFFAQVNQLSERAAVQYGINITMQLISVIRWDAPALIKAAGVEALLVDQFSLVGETVADFLGIPFITVCSALVLNQEPSVPPVGTHWNYSPAWWAHLRNQMGYMLVNHFGKPIRDLIAKYRLEWKLSPYSHPNDVYSRLAQLSQSPAEFEFPRQELPSWFHFSGPYHS